LRPIARLTPPATLDGGDVLVLDHDIVVGLTSRTNEMGASQLQDHLRPYGYAVRTVAVSQCLHLKSAVTRVGLDLLLVNPAWIERRHFDSWRLVESHPKEPFAANALWWGGNMVVHSEAHSRTRERLESAGVSVHPVPAAELAKGEGGVTCCALIVDGRAAPLARRNTPA
jgi:dimethylargininase